MCGVRTDHSEDNVRKLMVMAAVAALAGAVACQKTGEGEYQVETPDVDVSRDTTTVRTPTVDVRPETATVVVPNVDVNPPPPRNP